MRKNQLFCISATMMAMALASGFSSCSKDNDEADPADAIDATPITLFAGEEKAIEGADTVASTDAFVAYTKGNKVYGYHVGQAGLVANGKKTISLTVAPKYSLYDDPVCNWGCTQDYVKANQKQGTLSSRSTDTSLIYENAGAASFLMYTFENGKLLNVGAVVSTNHTTQYASFLAERYLMVPYYEGKDTYFIGMNAVELEKASTLVVLQVYNASYLICLYTSPSNYYTRSAAEDIQGSAKQLLDKLMESR